MSVDWWVKWCRNAVNIVNLHVLCLSQS